MGYRLVKGLGLNGLRVQGLRVQEFKGLGFMSFRV